MYLLLLKELGISVNAYPPFCFFCLVMCLEIVYTPDMHLNTSHEWSLSHPLHLCISQLYECSLFSSFNQTKDFTGNHTDSYITSIHIFSLLTTSYWTFTCIGCDHLQDTEKTTQVRLYALWGSGGFCVAGAQPQHCRVCSYHRGSD